MAEAWKWSLARVGQPHYLNEELRLGVLGLTVEGARGGSGATALVSILQLGLQETSTRPG
jgi:hypothetical protein